MASRIAIPVAGGEYDRDPERHGFTVPVGDCARTQDAMLRYGFGMFLFAYNRVAAAEQLAMAQPWDGFPVFLPDGTQIR